MMKTMKLDPNFSLVASYLVFYKSQLNPDRHQFRTDW